MKWMGIACDIVMAPGFRESAPAAVFSFVNMEAKESGPCFRKAADLRYHQHPIPVG